MQNIQKEHVSGQVHCKIQPPATCFSYQTCAYTTKTVHQSAPYVLRGGMEPKGQFVFKKHVV